MLQGEEFYDDIDNLTVSKEKNETPNLIEMQEMLKKRTKTNFTNTRNLIEKTPETKSIHVYEDIEELMKKQREAKLEATTSSNMHI